jgi:hypothetical protein
MTPTTVTQRAIDQPSDKTAIRPFHVNVPETELIELRRRLNATKWPERETVTDASQGVQLATTQALARYWATVSGASHSVYVSRPKEVAALIEESASHAR